MTKLIEFWGDGVTNKCQVWLLFKYTKWPQTLDKR